MNTSTNFKVTKLKFKLVILPILFNQTTLCHNAINYILHNKEYVAQSKLFWPTYTLEYGQPLHRKSWPHADTRPLQNITRSSKLLAICLPKLRQTDWALLSLSLFGSENHFRNSRSWWKHKHHVNKPHSTAPNKTHQWHPHFFKLILLKITGIL